MSSILTPIGFVDLLVQEFGDPTDPDINLMMSYSPLVKEYIRLWAFAYGQNVDNNFDKFQEATSMNNLPDGVTESMIPGNRPRDVAWDTIVEELDDQDVLDVCDCNHKQCDHSIWFTPVDDNLAEPVMNGCDLDVIDVQYAEAFVLGDDPTLCPFVHSLVEQRVEDRMTGADDPRCEPEYWEDR